MLSPLPLVRCMRDLRVYFSSSRRLLHIEHCARLYQRATSTSTVTRVLGGRIAVVQNSRDILNPKPLNPKLRTS
jgi:hypothetical protein